MTSRAVLEHQIREKLADIEQRYQADEQLRFNRSLATLIAFDQATSAKRLVARRLLPSQSGWRIILTSFCSTMEASFRAPLALEPRSRPKP